MRKKLILISLLLMSSIMFAQRGNWRGMGKGDQMGVETGAVWERETKWIQARLPRLDKSMGL